MDFVEEKLKWLQCALKVQKSKDSVFITWLWNGEEGQFIGMIHRNSFIWEGKAFNERELGSGG